MTTPRDINNYGGVFLDEIPVKDPTTQQSAAFANRANEDVAQMTRTTIKARVTFIPVAAAGPIALNPLSISVASHYGSGSSQKPVITKLSPGVYAVIFPTSFLDALGVSEDVSFLDADAAVRGPTNGSARIFSVATNAIEVNVYDAAGALTDLILDTIVVRAE